MKDSTLQSKSKSFASLLKVLKSQFKIKKQKQRRIAIFLPFREGGGARLVVKVYTEE